MSASNYKKNKKHRYKQNQYVEGYVPGDETPRKVDEVTGDIIISNPIVVERVVKTSGTNFIQMLPPNPTSADGDLASLTGLSKQPIPNTNVIVVLNGRVVAPADGPGGIATSACWFESPLGVVRPIGGVMVGDLLRWNGSYAGVEIEAGDELILIYEVEEL